MAHMRRMGSAEVEYHKQTVLERGDDHPGLALEYYGSRGETPLRWGGTGAARLGLSGAVTEDSYEKPVRPGRGPPSRVRGAAGDDSPARDGAGHVGPEVRRRAGRDRPGRRHARHHGRRTRRHLGLPGATHQGGRRQAGAGRQAGDDGRADLLPHPPRHHPGRRSRPARSCAAGQPGAHVGRDGRLEGGLHVAVAGPSTCRHPVRPRRLGSEGGGVGLRHRTRIGVRQADSGPGRSRVFPAPCRTCIRSGPRRSRRRSAAPVGPAIGPGTWRPGRPGRPNGTTVRRS